MQSWDTLSELLRDAGQEAHLARRMTEERTRRGWSQAELARQLEAKGYAKLGQPAISAIEKPKGRRAITVDDAIALSRVFDMPLAELLLPEGALADVELHHSLGYGADMRGEAYHQMGLYEHFVRDLAKKVRGSEAWTNHIDATLQAAREELERLRGQYTERSSRRYEAMKRLKQQVGFLEDVIRERDNGE